MIEYTRCNNLWCFYYLTKGLDPTTSQRNFYTGKNNHINGPYTYDYDTFTLDGTIYLGCSGYSGSLVPQSAMSGAIKDVRLINDFYPNSI